MNTQTTAATTASLSVLATADISEVTAAGAAAPAPAPAKKTSTKSVKPAKDKTATAVVAVPRTDTKKFKAIAIVTAGLTGQAARKDTLAKLQAELGISSACSNTYYQNTKARKSGWTA